MSFHEVRKVDIGVALSIIMIIGAIYAGFGKPASWDQAVKDVNDLKPRVENEEREISELRAINTTQMSMIIRELDGLHRELKNK
jgi:hypothetical protein